MIVYEAIYLSGVNKYKRRKTLQQAKTLEADKSDRRPIVTRDAGWAKWLSARLARSRITPNQISVFSVFFALAGAYFLLRALTPFNLVLCAIFIQGRLVCNLIDGMVAIEGGKSSALGAIYNEFPDRIADSVLIVALGYAISLPFIGWLGALLAALTAYIRVFGGSLGQSQSFAGPMAKQHRMAVMTFACILGAIEIAVTEMHYSLFVAAFIIAIGSAVTCITRTISIARKLG